MLGQKGVRSGEPCVRSGRVVCEVSQGCGSVESMSLFVPTHATRSRSPQNCIDSDSDSSQKYRLRPTPTPQS